MRSPLSPDKTCLFCPLWSEPRMGFCEAPLSLLAQLLLLPLFPISDGVGCLWRGWDYVPQCHRWLIGFHPPFVLAALAKLPHPRGDRRKSSPCRGTLAPALSGAICLMLNAQPWQRKEAIKVFGVCVTHANIACERQVCLLWHGL